MKYFLLAVVSVLVIVGCSSNDRVIIDGNVQGGSGATLFLSTLGVNGEQLIDSTVLNRNENFSFKVDRTEYPQFYYLRLDSSGGLTLLVDSVDCITVNSKSFRFDNNASVLGSPSSVWLHNSLLAVKSERKKYNDFVKKYAELPVGEKREQLMGTYADHLKEFKDSLGREILSQSWSMASYYVLYQKLSDSFLLYNPRIKQDYKYFGAVATGLKLKYPDDPRVKAFYKMTLAAFKEQRAAKMQKLISEAEAGIPDISLPNIDGDTLQLSDLKGKVVVLNFWGSTARESRIWNKTLARAYGNYKNKGLEIYQVSLDKSKILWEKAIRDDQISWITVGDYESGSLQEARSYNVTKLPTTYVIDRNGDITGRFEDEKSLMAEIGRLL